MQPAYFLYNIYQSGMQGLTGTSCHSDIGFVLDASESLMDERCPGCYSDEKNFVIKATRRLDFSSSGAHSSVTLYNKQAQLWIPFSETKTLAEFHKLVSELPFQGTGTSRVDEGLQVAYDEMFQTFNGMRVSNPKTLVLITDGNQLGIDYLEWRTKFSNAKIRLIVIGVGSEVSGEDLMDLAHNTTDLHFVDNFSDLLNDEFIDKISICDGNFSSCILVYCKVI